MAQCVPDPIHLDLRTGNNQLTYLVPNISLESCAEPRPKPCVKKTLSSWPRSMVSSNRHMSNGPTWQGNDDNLIATGGRANAAHFLLHHNPVSLPNGETDKEAIQRKEARITIARVMVHNRLDFWIKEKGLHLWIEQCWKMCASTTMVSLKFPLQDPLQAVATSSNNHTTIISSKLICFNNWMDLSNN